MNYFLTLLLFLTLNHNLLLRCILVTQLELLFLLRWQVIKKVRCAFLGLVVATASGRVGILEMVVHVVLSCSLLLTRKALVNLRR